MRQLLTYYIVDLWVIGSVDQDLMDTLPSNIRVFHHDFPGNKPSGYPSNYFLISDLERLSSCEPFLQEYDVVLGTSLFPSQRVCLVYSLLRAQHKYLFLVDEALLEYKNLSQSFQACIDAVILESRSVVSVSQDLFDKVKNYCQPLTQKQTYILPPLIDPEFEKVYKLWKDDSSRAIKTSTRSIILTVARLVPSKNLMACIRIHQHLKNKGLDVEWWIVGEGPQHEELQAAIIAHGLSQSCHLLGLRHDVPELLLKADLFVLLSESEGCPTVILEAVAMDCPVVTSAVHGVGLYVKHEYNGLVLNSDERSQNEAIEVLIRNPDKILEFKHHLKEGPRLLLNDKLEGFMAEIDRAINNSHQDTPLVTILIPTYNQASFLESAISSALMQDYPNLEVWVLDDASTDRSSEIVATWRHDARLHVVRHIHNLGRVANYRHGVYECAKGEWVLVLDGDDYYTDPHFVSEAISLINRHVDKDIVFVQAGHTSVYEDGSHSPTDILPPIEKDEACLTGVEYLKLVFKTGFFTHLGIVFNRAHAIAHGVYQKDISSSDMDSFMKLAIQGNVILMRQSVGCWRHHKHNASAHVLISDLAPNIKIFRTVVRLSTEQLLAKTQDFEPYLTLYEAHVLAYLYHRALMNHDSEHSLKTLFKIVYRINPRLFLQKKIRHLFWRAFCYSLRKEEV